MWRRPGGVAIYTTQEGHYRAQRCGPVAYSEVGEETSMSSKPESAV